VTHSISVLLQRVGRSGHGLAARVRRAASSRSRRMSWSPPRHSSIRSAAGISTARSTRPAPRHPGPAHRRRLRRGDLGGAAALRGGQARVALRALSREDFDDVVRLHTAGRARCSIATECMAGSARRGVPRSQRSPRAARSRTPASTGYCSSGGHPVGSLDEDFAVEANGGDIFQLGNASWRILRVEPESSAWPTRRAHHRRSLLAREAPSGHASFPSGGARPGARHGFAWLTGEVGLSKPRRASCPNCRRRGRALGAVPTPRCVVLDDSSTSREGCSSWSTRLSAQDQSRLGLALRKRFCRVGSSSKPRPTTKRSALARPAAQLSARRSFPVPPSRRGAAGTFSCRRSWTRPCSARAGAGTSPLALHLIAPR